MIVYPVIMTIQPNVTHTIFVTWRNKPYERDLTLLVVLHPHFSIHMHQPPTKRCTVEVTLMKPLMIILWNFGVYIYLALWVCIVAVMLRINLTHA
jgi:hypothetical protein